MTLFRFYSLLDTSISRWKRTINVLHKLFADKIKIYWDIFQNTTKQFI